MTEESQTISLPEPDGILVIRAITDRLLDDQKTPLIWVVGERNPMAKEVRIVRMYAGSRESDESSEERELRIYSVSPSKIVRHTIPASRVRLIEESLEPDVLLSEIHVEEGLDEEDDNEIETEEEKADTQPPDAEPNGALS